MAWGIDNDTSYVDMMCEPHTYCECCNDKDYSKSSFAIVFKSLVLQLLSKEELNLSMVYDDLDQLASYFEETIPYIYPNIQRRELDAG